MKKIRLSLVIATLFTLVTACGGTQQDISSTSAIPHKNYQIKLNGLCWDNATNGVHTFLRSCTTAKSTKWQLIPLSGLVYGNNSDYVKIVSQNTFLCLTDTRNAIGQGDLSMKFCSFPSSSAADKEAQKFYVSNTNGVIKIFGYKDFFLSLPNPKTVCVYKNPSTPLISQNLGCSVQQPFNLVQVP